MQLYTVKILKDFFLAVNLGTQSLAEAQTLEKDLTREVIQEAIKNLLPGKTPRPDSLPVHFHRSCPREISQPLLVMFNYAHQIYLFADSLNLAMLVPFKKTQ